MSAYRYGNLIFGIGILFPGKIILFWCAGSTVTCPLRIIARQDQPNGGKELHDHIRALVGQVLADALRHGNCAALQLNDGKSDTVDVQHQIRALVFDSDFFSNVKVIFKGMLPIHKLDCDFMLADRLADLDAVAQLFIGLLIQVVKVHRLISGSILQFLQGTTDEHRRITLAGQELRQQLGFNIGVFPFSEITQIGITKFLGK